MANTSLILSNIDFEAQKNTLKQYLRSQPEFTDYDFDGSNMSVLLDVLSYNTYLNTFYLNMVGSEMFLDSAQLRDSAVSHAKQLNYTPRSFSSATADVGLTIATTDLSRRSITLPKGTSFSSKIGSRPFTFVTNEALTTTTFEQIGNQLFFTVPKVALFEGVYLSDSFVSGDRFILTNRNVDISSINVVVIEDDGADIISYNRATSLFGIDANSAVYFIQASANETYEVVFGDGVSGRRPKENSVILIEYRICNGQLPNGCSKFTPDGTVDSGAVITNVQVLSKAGGGDVPESIESIKFNAPRHFASQERAVTTEDYVSILKQRFPEINDAIAYGGETLTPPQFGKVFIAVDLTDVDGVPQSKKSQYTQFITPRVPVAIQPVFVEAETLFVGVNTTVNYNINRTSLTEQDIRSTVLASILDYNNTSLNGFGKVLRYSRLIRAIDQSQVSLISNETDISLIKEITPQVGRLQTIDVDFTVPLQTTETRLTSQPNQPGLSTRQSTIVSSPFLFNNQSVVLQDNGSGQINLVSTVSRTNVLVASVGTVDYQTGLVQLIDFSISGLLTPKIKIFAVPRSKDVAVEQNVVLSIRREDVLIDVKAARE